MASLLIDLRTLCEEFPVIFTPKRDVVSQLYDNIGKFVPYMNLFLNQNQFSRGERAGAYDGGEFIYLKSRNAAARNSD